jgi:hypothetical protein
VGLAGQCAEPLDETVQDGAVGGVGRLSVGSVGRGRLQRLDEAIVRVGVIGGEEAAVALQQVPLGFFGDVIGERAEQEV